MGVFKALSDVVESLVAFLVLILMAVLSFFFTVFIVDMGAGLAGYTNLDGSFVILSATLLVLAAIIAGALN